MSDRTVVDINDVSMTYPLYDNPRARLKEALHPMRKKYHRDFHALKDIDLEVRRGEILGIVGRNGAGKSTLLKVISGVLQPTTGTVTVDGSIAALLELGAGFNPELTGMQNIYFYGSVMGFSRQEMTEMLDDILAFADIGQFIDQPLKSYSSGMKGRLGFAVSTMVNPDLLIVDEVLAVGDAVFQRKCYGRIESLFKSGKSVILVSHSRNSITTFCDRAVLLDEGEIMHEGSADAVMQEYDRLCNRKYAVQKTVESTAETTGPDETAEPAREEAAENELPNESKPAAEPVVEVAADEPGEASPAPEDDEIVFNEKLVPEPKTYRRSDVDIVSFALHDQHRRTVNVLRPGRTYRISCEYVFHEDLFDIEYAVRIKNIQGLVLSWFGYPTEKRNYFDVRAGQRLTLEFDISCNLLEGTYLIDAGFQSFDASELVFHFAQHDLYMFEVLRPSKANLFGMVFLDMKPATFRLVEDEALSEKETQ